jgi:hypothetical protein
VQELPGASATFGKVQLFAAVSPLLKMDAYATGEQGICFELLVNQWPQIQANLQLTDTNKVRRTKIFRLRDTHVTNAKRRVSG